MSLEPEISVQVELAAVTRRMSPGQTRVVLTATKNGEPSPVFLCCVEPPNTYERVMRESFYSICSVEDLAEYPVGVSSVEEIDPAIVEVGTFLYAAFENRVYTRSTNDNNQPVWIPYIAAGTSYVQPNVHTNKLPFFRKHQIDIIFPNREQVFEYLEVIKHAILRLEQDMFDLEKLKNFDTWGAAENQE
jgi:hypothetical protein